jgi:uncharacterized membrane protein
MNKKYLVILILILINIVASLATINPSESEFCTVNEINGCSVIDNTQFSKTLGIENGYLGILGFSVLALITFSYLKSPKKSKEKIILSLSIIASIIAIYFLFLQTFIIKIFCNYCLIVDINCLIILSLQIKWKQKFFLKEQKQ